MEEERKKRRRGKAKKIRIKTQDVTDC